MNNYENSLKKNLFQRESVQAVASCDIDLFSAAAMQNAYVISHNIQVDFRFMFSIYAQCTS